MCLGGKRAHQVTKHVSRPWSSGLGPQFWTLVESEARGWDDYWLKELQLHSFHITYVVLQLFVPSCFLFHLTASSSRSSLKVTGQFIQAPCWYWVPNFKLWFHGVRSVTLLWNFILILVTRMWICTHTSDFLFKWPQHIARLYQFKAKSVLYNICLVTLNLFRFMCVLGQFFQLSRLFMVVNPSCWPDEFLYLMRNCTFETIAVGNFLLCRLLLSVVAFHCSLKGKNSC